MICNRRKEAHRRSIPTVNTQIIPVISNREIERKLHASKALIELCYRRKYSRRLYGRSGQVTAADTRGSVLCFTGKGGGGHIYSGLIKHAQSIR